jgi:hypothetical protein
VDLKKIAEKTKALEIPVDDDVLHVQYRPNALTVGDAMAGARTPDEIVDLVRRTIVQWDLTDGGVEVPITVEAMKTVPFPFLASVVEAVSTDMSVGETNGAS